MSKSHGKLYYDLLDGNLSKSAIIFYTLLLSNVKDKGYAYGTNKYYAKKLRCSTRTISSLIKTLVDKDYIWFNICQKELYKDKFSVDGNNLSFFSARMYIEYSYKINLRVGKDVYVEGIPKGYVDKNGYRQNYIHILKINLIEVNKEPPLYGDRY